MDKPNKGDEVTIEYTGNLYDPSKSDDHCRGQQYVRFPSSWYSEPLLFIPGSTLPRAVEILKQLLEWEKSSKVCQIPMHYVTTTKADYAAGWDEGVVEMTLGEKSILTISG